MLTQQQFSEALGSKRLLGVTQLTLSQGNAVCSGVTCSVRMLGTGF